MATTNDDDQKCVDLTAEEVEDEVIELDEDEDVGEVEEEACCICQDVVSLVKQGFLSSCEHRFHFDCIVTWSKVTNLCPLCKLKFNEVVRKDPQGEVVHRERIADTKQVFRPDPRDHDMTAQLRLVNNVRCEICGRGDDEHVLLMCEAPHCMNSSHTYCVGLAEVPTHSWYCSHHQGGPARASDLIVRPASTVSSRRRTRRLASLMSNILSGVGAVRRRPASASGSIRGSRTRRGGARLTMPDGEGLDLASGRPIRGVALSYAVHMSRELQAIQQRANAMFARGDLAGASLYAPPRASLLGARSTSTRSTTDQMWDDHALSRRHIAEAAQPRTTPGEQSPQFIRAANPNRVSPTFTTEYRDIAKRMADAASHDNYASTVSLTIPKTARLRLVSSVKSFFGKLNEREKMAALDAGCLTLLFSWIRAAETTGATAGAANELHPHVLEAVLTVLEGLPVRKEDLSEVKGFQKALDETSNQPNTGIDFRERCVVLSEKWREIDPPPPSASLRRVHATPYMQPARHDQTPSLPAIQSFTTRGEGSHSLTAGSRSEQSGAKKKAAKRKLETAKKPDVKSQDEWSALAVDYVKGKLYPLYKDSNGKMSKDQFKGVVKQVVARFRVDASAMQSRIVEAGGGQLTSFVKKRLMQLLDQVYRESRTNMATPGRLAPSGQQGNASYSAVPSSLKRPRTS